MLEIKFYAEFWEACRAMTTEIRRRSCMIDNNCTLNNRGIALYSQRVVFELTLVLPEYVTADTKTILVLFAVFDI